MWLMCMVINVQGNNYYTTMWWMGSRHVWLTCTVINVQGNNYLYGRGEPSCVAHVHGK